VTQRPGVPATGSIVIAIDGPSGSGKSTVARGVAAALTYRYVDTGAMYRALTWLALDRGVDLHDARALAALVEAAELVLSTDPAAPTIAVAGTDVTSAIRTPEVTAAVSAVSAVPELRATLVRRQRAELAGGAVVVEGRDIGTTVAPDAEVKIFLTADPEARAQRRGAELAGTQVDATTVASTRQQLLRRDEADSTRQASPLAQASDALVIDSTDLTAAEVVERVLAEVAAVRR
jgi:cytidylate kinase